MRIFPLITLLIFCLFSGCGNDGVLSGDATIVGDWELSKAMRNNMETEMLNGLYYSFQADGTLVTNLMSEGPVQGSYVWEDLQVTTESVIPALDYTIKELTDSTLHIQSKYQGYQFNFELIRKKR